MALEVDFIEFHVIENARRHNTFSFEITGNEPVLRRGQKFQLTFVFDRNFDYESDVIKCTFKTGLIETEETVGRISFEKKSESDGLENSKWSGRIISTQNKALSVEIIAPFNAPFGQYSLEINCQNGESTSTYNPNMDLWMLYNPWIKEDQTFMEDTRLLDEYILNDFGKIWMVDNNWPKGRPWFYGQFTKSILKACDFILDKANVPHSDRGDVKIVSRAISRIVNANDDSGVLVGNWGNNFDNHTHPSSWTGSVEILEEYLEKSLPVRYGQCFVFAGVVTTICRAIGLPCRPVTNLNSAHDSNNTLTIDYYLDEYGNQIEFKDSIWTFHVWNEVYMSRPDLPSGFGGWQVIDSTPMERSDGFSQCGPASVEAIRMGEMDQKYDVGFMVASVNADCITWIKTFGEEYKKLRVNKNQVGRAIMTKKPWYFDPNGEKDREDIIHLYKGREGSNEERIGLYNAARHTRSAKECFDIADGKEQDVTFELNDLVEVAMGAPFFTTIYMHNKSAQMRRITVLLTIQSVYYNGNKAKVFVRQTEDVNLRPGQKFDYTKVIRPHVYMKGLVEYNHMKIFAICTVHETKYTWSGEDDFQISRPRINIEISPKFPVGYNQSVTFSFPNPLRRPLLKGYFVASIPNTPIKTRRIYVYNVNPGNMVKGFFSFKIPKPGKYTIVVTFTSPELLGMSASEQFEVLENRRYYNRRYYNRRYNITDFLNLFEMN